MLISVTRDVTLSTRGVSDLLSTNLPVSDRLLEGDGATEPPNANRPK